jgi:trk system potassium uptake protein TrkA
MPKIAVLGLGRFGMTLVRELVARNAEVLAVDLKKELVDQASDAGATVAVMLDITDEEALNVQNLADMDVCVIAVGERFECTILTTFNIRQLSPPEKLRIVARAQTAQQAEILKRVGADLVIQPESEAAHSLGLRLVRPRQQDILELDKVHSVLQIPVPRAFVGQPLSKLKWLQRANVDLLLLKRPLPVKEEAEEPQEVAWEYMRNLADDEKLRDGDVLVLFGETPALEELSHS